MNVKIKSCPRCKGTNILHYEEIAECLDCNEEFEKKDFLKIRDVRLILSLREKQELIETIGLENQFK